MLPIRQNLPHVTASPQTKLVCEFYFNAFFYFSIKIKKLKKNKKKKKKNQHYADRMPLISIKEK
jgi:uncharacterized membrane protein YciS (DUF1049 family)